jgi:hypothetical protein
VTNHTSEVCGISSLILNGQDTTNVSCAFLFNGADCVCQYLAGRLT